jgi:hypothetical protein
MDAAQPKRVPRALLEAQDPEVRGIQRSWEMPTGDDDSDWVLFSDTEGDLVLHHKETLHYKRRGMDDDEAHPSDDDKSDDTVVGEVAEMEPGDVVEDEAMNEEEDDAMSAQVAMEADASERAQRRQLQIEADAETAREMELLWAGPTGSLRLEPGILLACERALHRMYDSLGDNAVVTMYMEAEPVVAEQEEESRVYQNEDDEQGAEAEGSEEPDEGLGWYGES